MDIAIVKFHLLGLIPVLGGFKDHAPSGLSIGDNVFTPLIVTPPESTVWDDPQMGSPQEDRWVNDICLGVSEIVGLGYAGSTGEGKKNMIALLYGTEHRCCLTSCLEDIFFFCLYCALSVRQGFGRRIKNMDFSEELNPCPPFPVENSICGVI